MRCQRKDSTLCPSSCSDWAANITYFIGSSSVFPAAQLTWLKTTGKDRWRKSALPKYHLLLFKRIHQQCRRGLWSLGREDPLEKRSVNPLQYSLPGKSHWEGSLAGHSPWGHKESDKTEWLNNKSLTLFKLSAFVLTGPFSTVMGMKKLLTYLLFFICIFQTDVVSYCSHCYW